MTWLLAFDGALGPLSVALLSRDGRIARAAETGGNGGLEGGLGLVKDLLGGETLDALRAIAVGTGPGRYTGLRIALSYAKSIAFARALPLIAVSSYDAVEPVDAPLPLASFVSGRAGTVCARLRNERGVLTRCGADASVADALAERLAPEATLNCAGAWQGAAPRLGERGIIVRPCPPIEPPPALAIARKALDREPAPSPHAVRADYGVR